MKNYLVFCTNCNTEQEFKYKDSYMIKFMNHPYSWHDYKCSVCGLTVKLTINDETKELVNDL